MRIHDPERGWSSTLALSLVLFVVAAPLLGAVPSGKASGATPASKPTAQVTSATAPRDAVRLSIQVGTTSDWTVLRLTPGEVLAAATTSTDNAVVDRQGAQWRVAPVDPTRAGWATFDAVVYDPGTTDVTAQVQKGFVGRTRVTLVDVQRGVTVLSAVDDVQSTSDPLNSRSWTLAREDVYAEPIDLPLATAEKRVLAFYYPWFERYDDPALTDHPLDPRSTYSGADVRDMTRQAKGAGVDGFVVSWAGQDADGWGFDRALAAAEAEGQVVAGYLEVPRAPDATRGATVYAWLRELLSRSDSPAYLTQDGVPVVFVYAMEELPAWMWGTMRNQLAAEGQQVRLVGDTGRPEYAAVTWAEHRYSALGTAEERAAHGRRQALALRAATVVEGAEPMAWVATVAPGYDDHLVRGGNPVVDREDGRRYEDTWDAALVSQPDWVVITSWNEWFEGTSIEPSVSFGDLALRQTADRAAAWTGQDTAATTTTQTSRGKGRKG